MIKLDDLCIIGGVMPSAYNQALEESDAKYKIYLHQDTFIYNKRIVFEIVDFFQKYPQVGMIGVVGGSYLPKSEIWFEDGLHSFGKVWGNRPNFLNLPILNLNKRKKRIVYFRPVRKPYQPVLVIDGLIMITQYDLPWRSDLFDSFLYYEGPHSLEFIKHGYQVAIPYQKEPWCMHWGPEIERSPIQHQAMWAGIRKNAEIFLKEYDTFIQKNVNNFIKKG